MTTVLGFDVSSSCIGWALLKINDDLTINFVKMDHIKPTKNGPDLQVLIDTRDRVSEIINEIEPDHIVIENIIYYMKGRSTANTIIALATYNRIVCITAFDYLKKLPELFNVKTIRAGIKKNSFPKKEEIPDLVASHLGITFPYEKDKKGKLFPYNFDRADSIAVALYFCFILIGKVKRKQKFPKKLNRKALQEKRRRRLLAPNI